MPAKPPVRLVKKRTVSTPKRHPKRKRRDKKVDYFLIYEGKDIKLDKRKKYVIGRSNECNIQIIKPEVSRTHGSIKWNPVSQTFEFKDLNSYNGSLINGKPVNWDYLKNGDIINLARNKILFEQRTTASPKKAGLPPPTNRATMLLERKFASIMRYVDDTQTMDQLKEYHELIISIRENLSLLAYHDELTGLFNRRYFDNSIKHEVKMSRRNKNPFSLVMIDIDHFKKFNDTYGHQKGDEMLEGVAGFIRSAIRETDIACRYGGEEIAVILPNTTSAKALKVAEKIRKKIVLLSPQQFGVKVTVSLGIATMTESIKIASQLIKTADKSLYLAKDRGRNCAVAV